MDPDSFLDRESVFALSEEEQETYVASVGAALRVARAGGDEAPMLTCSAHLLDLAEWALPPEEYDEPRPGPAWDAAWENAEGMLSLCERVETNPEASDRDRASAAEQIEPLRAIVEHSGASASARRRIRVGPWFTLGLRTAPRSVRGRRPRGCPERFCGVGDFGETLFFGEEGDASRSSCFAPSQGVRVVREHLRRSRDRRCPE